MALVAIVGSYILQPSSQSGLTVYVPILEQRIELPETCMSKRLLGISCPGCGLTRSFVFAARGNWQRSWNYNPMGPILFLLVLSQIPYRVIEYLGWGASIPFWSSVSARLHLLTYALIIALIAAWTVRMLDEVLL